VLLVGPLSAAAQPSQRCGPFDSPAAPGATGRSSEPGLIPGTQRPPRSGEGGTIVELPGEAAEAHSQRLPGEALLALPVGVDGSVPTDFELRPGSRIVAAFFSQVLCASIALLVGPRDAEPSEFILNLPEGAIVVPHHVYTTAAAESDPLPKDSAASPRADPYRPLQYGLDRAAVSAARALTTGRGVRVAVLDSPVEVHHRDLTGARAVPLALDGETEIPLGARHGTLVAGVVGATEGNGFGIAGLAPEAELLSLPTCRPVPDTTADLCRLYELLQGVERAWLEQANVITLTLVGVSNPLLERAMNRLEELGVLVVAAAGNEGSDEPRYPAAYPSVISVSAIDAQDHVHGRANRGAWVDVLAPGVEILSTVPGDSFAFATGSSLAAAHVAGVVALLQAVAQDAALVRAAFLPSLRSDEAAGEEAPRARTVCDALSRMGWRCAPTP
jgi:subtilisin family serine protease